MIWEAFENVVPAKILNLLEWTLDISPLINWPNMHAPSRTCLLRDLSLSYCPGLSNWRYFVIYIFYSSFLTEVFNSITKHWPLIIIIRIMLESWQYKFNLTSDQWVHFDMESADFGMGREISSIIWSYRYHVTEMGLLIMRNVIELSLNCYRPK